MCGCIVVTANVGKTEVSHQCHPSHRFWKVLAPASRVPHPPPLLDLVAPTTILLLHLSPSILTSALLCSFSWTRDQVYVYLTYNMTSSPFLLTLSFQNFNVHMKYLGFNQSLFSEKIQFCLKPCKVISI